MHRYLTNAITGILVPPLVGATGITAIAAGAAFTVLPSLHDKPKIVLVSDHSTATKHPPKRFCEDGAAEKWCSVIRKATFQVGLPPVPMLGIDSSKYTNFLLPRVGVGKTFVLHKAKSGSCLYAGMNASQLAVLVGKCIHDKVTKFKWFYRLAAISRVTGFRIYEIASRLKFKTSSGKTFSVCMSDYRFGHVAPIDLVQCETKRQVLRETTPEQGFYWLPRP